MTAHDGRLLPAALLALLGCWALAGGAPGLSVTLLCAVIAGMGLAVWGMARGPRRALWRDVGLAAVAAGTLAGVVAGGAALRIHWAEQAISSGGGHLDVMEVVVASHVMPADSDRFTGAARVRFDAVVQAADGASVRIPVTILMDAAQAAQAGVHRGAHVSLHGKLEPGSRAGLGVVWDASPRDRAHGASQAEALIARVRSALTETAAGLDTRWSGLTLGMAIGDDSTMTDVQVRAMRVTGLAHLTAVSGAHFAVVIVLLQALLRLVRPHRVATAVILTGGMLAFVTLVGPEPAVLRALAMGLAIGAGLAWGRRARALPALSAGILALLAVDPWLAAELGFQLSVAAVAAIVLWSPHVAARLERRLVPALARAVAVTFTASAATFPLLVGVSGGVGTYGVVANVLAALAAAPVTVLGLTGAVAALPWPDASEALLRAASWPATAVGVTAEALAGAPLAWLEWSPGPWSRALAWLVLAVLIAATTSHRVRGWWRIAALLTLAALLTATGPLTARPAPSLPDWSIVVCDVGQGDMILVRTGEGAAIVIDVGPDDAAAVACLARHGVTAVPLLILTHPHADHEGGLAGVLAEVPVGRAWTSGSVPSSRAETLLDDAGVPREAVSGGLSVAVGDARLHVLAPASGSVFHGPEAVNDASVVVLAEHRGVSLLALGDLETAGQEALAARWGPLIVDVVKVAHHGSADQSPALARLLTSRIAVISVGEGNGYGHPAPSALGLYEDRSVVLLRTDQCGDVSVARREGLSVASRCPLPVAP